MFEPLFNNAFLYSLSLTLVHFLWQGLLVGLILKSALFIIDQKKSTLRYGIASFAMLSNAILAVITFTMVYPDTSSGVNSSLSPIPLTSLVNELTQQNALLSYQELLPSILAYSLPYISILWLATITMLAGKLLIEVRNVNNLPMHSSIAPSSTLLARFDELAKQIKLTETPRLLISLKADVPMAIGWLKPVVLLPASMVTGLDSAQLEMLILHELAHIRRHDYLVNFFQTLIELLFFFHPSVHWIGKQMRNEREYCSDDIAVQHCGDAIAYAHTLTDTASLCAKKHFHTIPTMAMAASGGDLKARVIRLVDHHCAPSNHTSKWLAAISLLLALSLLGINQLLTMPFAQQVKNHFPWQESGSTTPNSFQSVDTLISRPNYGVGSLTNDSIAQQLLGNNELNNTPLIDISSVENSSFLITANDILPTAKLKSAKTKQSNEFINRPALQAYSITSQAVESDNITTVKTTFTDKQTSAAAEDIEKAELKPILISDKTKLKQKPAAISLDAIEAKPVIASFIMENTNIAKAKNLAQSTSVATDFSSQQMYQGIVPQKLDNDYLASDTTYKQLSYSQEISQLARQNDLYQASKALTAHDLLAVKTIEHSFARQMPLKTNSSKEAKLLKSISPVYPTLAKRRGIEMEVKVDFTIDRNGKVKDINFGQKSKLIYFKSAIRSAIRKWRFSPATKGNRKIESKMSKIFSFSLHA